MQPLVTVIIPVKNRPEWFRQALKSVFDQQYPNIEIVIIDDGSDPPIEQQISNIEIAKINHIIRNTRSMGPGLAREQGRRIASGKYINYLDSDDILLPEKILMQVEQLESDQSIGMSYCISSVFSENEFYDTEIWSISDQSYTGILPIILYQRPWSTSSCLWRKSILDSIGPWSDLSIGEDIEYEVRAGCNDCTVIHLPRTLCRIRKHGGNGITKVSIDHQIQESEYKLLVAENIYGSSYFSDENTKIRVREILFNQFIFLLTQRQIAKGRICLKMAIKYCTGNNSNKIFLWIIYYCTYFLPIKLVIRMSRFFRSHSQIFRTSEA